MRINMLILTQMENYDDWLANGFNADSERRKLMCDESKTRVARMGDNEAVILLYDVDVDRLKIHMNETIMQELEARFKTEHTIYTFSPID